MSLASPSPRAELGQHHAATLPDPEIFRAYDIRGVVGDTLSLDAAYRIARAFATKARDANQRRVAVGGDGRGSTPALRDEIVRGLREGGTDVVDIGRVPTPLLYYATHVLETGTGIMITGSHNPPEYNGLKMMLGGATLAGDDIQGLRRLVERGSFSVGDGTISTIDLAERYVAQVIADTTCRRPLKVVVDCGNGVAGLVAPRLLEKMGCEVIPLYAEVDGTFPNHHPDPADAGNLGDLIDTVRTARADLGLAFDGDADRLGVVTDAGGIVWPDRVLMLFSRDIVPRHPGATVVLDVKCSRHLGAVVRRAGGRPIMWRTGHSHIKAKIRDTGAVLGGEFSGHICLADRWYGFDDAIYSAARLVELVSAQNEPAGRLFAEFPEAISTPEIKVPTTEQRKFELIEALADSVELNGAGEMNTIDGIRVDYDDGWGLVRASNTSPVLTLRFEADHQAALDRIQAAFDAALTGVDPALSFLSRAPT